MTNKRKRKIDAIVSGNVKKNEYDLVICPTSDAGPNIEISLLSRADLREILSAVSCALEKP